VPRSLDQYLESGWLRLQRGVAAMAAAAWAATGLLEPGASREVELPSAGELWAFVAAAVGVGALAEWAQRRILRQPQPAVDPQVIAADDTVRATSVHAIAGASTGFLVMLGSGAGIVLADGQPVIGVVGVIVGLWLWHACTRPHSRTAGPGLLVGATVGLALVVVAAGMVLLLRAGSSSYSDSDSVPGQPVLLETTIPVIPTTVP
jgi:hypothetical protein